MASLERKAKQEKEYLDIADLLKRLSSKPPVSFYDALQMI